MKLQAISAAILALALTSTAFAHKAEVMTVTQPAPAMSKPGKIYVGLFGGLGSTNELNVSQYGTAFITEASGGPLAVNAFGETGNRSASMLGLQIGYQGDDIAIHPRTLWMVAPAVELEGFTFDNETFSAELINATTRLTEHDFISSFPTSRNVFLANAVFNFDHPAIVVHPYVGLGLGGAVVRISGADSTQIAPPEAGLNHFNGNTSDTSAAFAGQIKAGLAYNFNQWLSVFAEYRWVYIANTHFIFGSTIVPGHAETSSWQVNLDSQRTNIGSVGIRVSV